MCKYIIEEGKTLDGKIRYMIYNTEENAYFAGYDFMGSPNWEHELVHSIDCEFDTIICAEYIMKDLISADI